MRSAETTRRRTLFQVAATALDAGNLQVHTVVNSNRADIAFSTARAPVVSGLNL